MTRKKPKPPAAETNKQTDDPTNKTKGRPVGAKTAPRDEDCKILARCRRCHSTDLRVEGIQRRLAHAGVDLMTKLPYNLTVWHRQRCVSCGAKLLTKTHHFVPDPHAPEQDFLRNSPG